MNAARIGVVIVGHADIPPAMGDAARTIVGHIEGVVAVGIAANASIDVSRQRLAKAIAAVDSGNGVLLLSDMFGGTPSNLCLAVAQSDRIAVISGFNLPMLIKLVGGYQTRPFAEVLATLPIYGQKNIVNACTIVEGKTDASA